MPVCGEALPTPRPGRGGSLSNYRIFETDEYLKRLGKMSSVDAEFIQRKAKSYIYPQLREQPHFGTNVKKLVGYTPETWRYRLGKYRLFYLIDEKELIVFVATVEFRKDDY